MFARKIKITDEWSLLPAVGLSYVFGVSANSNWERTEYEHNMYINTVKDNINLYSEDNWTRSAINAKLAINLTYKNYLIGVGVNYGTCDMGDLGINLGYNF